MTDKISPQPSSATFKELKTCWERQTATSSTTSHSDKNALAQLSAAQNHPDTLTVNQTPHRAQTLDHKTSWASQWVSTQQDIAPGQMNASPFASPPLRSIPSAHPLQHQTSSDSLCQRTSEPYSRTTQTSPHSQQDNGPEDKSNIRYFTDIKKDIYSGCCARLCLDKAKTDAFLDTIGQLREGKKRRSGFTGSIITVLNKWRHHPWVMKSNTGGVMKKLINGIVNITGKNPANLIADITHNAYQQGQHDANKGSNASRFSTIKQHWEHQDGECERDSAVPLTFNDYTTTADAAYLLGYSEKRLETLFETRNSRNLS